MRFTRVSPHHDRIIVNDTQPSNHSDDIVLRRLLLKTIGGILILMSLLAALSWVFSEPLIEISRGYVNALGGLGIFLGFAIPDATTFPVPPDVFLALGSMGGMAFWKIVLWASAGSLTGGSLGFAIGLFFRRTARFQRWMKRHGKQVNRLMQRYGTAALGIAAMTPVPYSIACHASSAGGMSYGRFFLVSLLRIPRVLIFLWLIQLGIIPSPLG